MNAESLMSRVINDELCELMGGFFSLLAHPTRIRIFCALKHGPRTVSALAEQSRISLSNASQHLRIMRQNGALATEKCGQNVYYRIADPRFIQAAELIRNALVEKVQSRAQLAAHGAAYDDARCPNPGERVQAMLAMPTVAADNQNNESVVPL